MEVVAYNSRPFFLSEFAYFTDGLEALRVPYLERKVVLDNKMTKSVRIVSEHSLERVLVVINEHEGSVGIEIILSPIDVLDILEVLSHEICNSREFLRGVDGVYGDNPRGR